MGILSLANSVAPKTAATPKKREASELWLNVGIDRNDKFVSLPFGLALDTMAPVEARGQNVEFVQFQKARNALLEELKELASSLAPGEEMEIPMLVVKIRRKNDELDLSKEENPFKVSIKELMSKS